jgi:hypothetical protein
MSITSGEKRRTDAVILLCKRGIGRLYSRARFGLHDEEARSMSFGGRKVTYRRKEWILFFKR